MASDSSPSLDPVQARQFAVSVVRTLREAGFAAYWAGGCVRDDQLGKQPKDYDVATEALPEQVRDVFGKRRTLPIGAAFGVITVLGSKPQGQIEVATFREDAEYSDGRHPDGVSFTNAEEDAKRRDFTINGMFYDPIEEQVLDFVGGMEDLERKHIRAIGDPRERINEDKLRMLRAVRFASTLEFSVDPPTLAAVQECAEQLSVVSAERITVELQKMLSNRNRRVAVELLHESRLMPQCLRGLDQLDAAAWSEVLLDLEALEISDFASALSLLIRPAANGLPLEQITERLRLSNEQEKTVRFVLENEASIRDALDLPWHHTQRILIQEKARELVAVVKAMRSSRGLDLAPIDFCLAKLDLPRNELDPAPLIDGAKLMELGLRPGPIFRRILEGVRDAQLDGEITTEAQAIELAKTIAD